MTYTTLQKSLVLAFILALIPFSGGATAQSDPAFGEKLDNAMENVRKGKKQEKAELREMKVNSPIVLELFTTSDCSACIFADRMLYDALKDKSVIGLSCHIKDVGALESRNEKDNADRGKVTDGPMDPCIFRQWSYKHGRAAKDVTLGIPGFIFNGSDQVSAEGLNFFDSMLNSYHYAYKNKVLEVFMKWKDDDTITVHLPQASEYDDENMNASVWIIRYKDMAVERIDEGINKGRVLRFSNIVEDIKHIAKWHGAMRAIDVDVPKPQGGKERGGYAVLVQEMMGEPVLAAGKLEDYPHPDDAKKPAAAEAPAVKEQPLVIPAPQ